MMAGQTADEGAYKIYHSPLEEGIYSVYLLNMLFECRAETVRQSAKLLHAGAEAMSLFGSAVGLANQVCCGHTFPFKLVDAYITYSMSTSDWRSE